MFVKRKPVGLRRIDKQIISCLVKKMKPTQMTKVKVFLVLHENKPVIVVLDPSEVSRECNIGGPDELHPFTKNSETGLTLKPESAFLLDGVRYIQNIRMLSIPVMLTFSLGLRGHPYKALQGTSLRQRRGLQNIRIGSRLPSLQLPL